VSPVTRTRWVTFDCYGTLIDWQTGFAAMVARVAGDRVADVVRAYDAHERILEQARPHRLFKDVVVTSLVRSASEVGASVSEADARRLLGAWAELRPFDDAEALLAGLRRRGYRLGVLTNCDDDLFEVTHRTFTKPFDLFVTAERVRGYKPAPWHFRAFEMLTRVRRGDWVHVAASRHHDIDPAQTLGIKHVWLDRAHDATGAATVSAYATSGAEVIDAVDRLMHERRHGLPRSTSVDTTVSMVQPC